MRSICAALVLACAAHSGAALTTTGTARTAPASSALSATNNAHGEGLDRRTLFGKVAGAAAIGAAGAGFPFPAFAAGAPPTEAEIQRIKTG